MSKLDINNISPSISVLIPCYKGGNTLPACLNSIMRQSCQNLEIIIIDDGSPDKTESIAKDYIKSHFELNIRIFTHDHNLGVSTSRNEALAYAHGEYVTFLDVDDELEPDFCEKLLDVAQSKKLDIVACNARRIITSTNIKEVFPHISEIVFNPHDFAENSRYQPFFDTCWGKLYRREMIERSGLKFKKEMSFGEDTLFAHSAVLSSTQIGILGTFIGYNYHYNTESCTAQISLARRLSNLSMFLLELQSRISEKDKILLLRKAQEYLWSIRKFGGHELDSALNEMLQSDLWRNVLVPVLSSHAKFKHRLIVKGLKQGLRWPIHFLVKYGQNHEFSN